MKNMKFECPRCLGHKFYEPNENDTHYVCTECCWDISAKKAKKMNNDIKLTKAWEDVEFATEQYDNAERDLMNAQNAYDKLWNKIYCSK
jgi:hypothetical protein